MGYCFMTIEKVKDYGTLTRKYEHNYREGYVPNADSNKAEENEELVSLNGKTYSECFIEKLMKLDYYKKYKLKHNQVMALEIVTTFSREERERVDLDKWKEDNVKWLQQEFNKCPEKYGDNVVSVMYHGDEEGNVHCHALVIPIDETGKLSASKYIDGRKRMIELQDSYGELMMKNHKLERGLKGSIAKHSDIKRYYASLNATINKELPTIEAGESAFEYRERANEYYRDVELKHLNQKYEMERKINQAITYSKQERHEFLTERDEFVVNKKKFEKKLGDMRTALSKIKTLDLLHNGLKNYPDRQFANELLNGMQKVMEKQREINEVNRNREDMEL